MKKAKQARKNQHLIDERIRHGWSQQEVADRIGTTPVNVSRWERGATAPSPYFRQQLSTLFGKSPQALGLLPQVSDPSEVTKLLDQATSQTHLVNDEKAQDMYSSFSTQKTGTAFPYVDGGGQAPEYQPLAHQLPPRHPRRWFSSPPTSARWGIALACTLILILMTYLLLRSNGIPIPYSGGSVVARTTSAAEPVPTAYGVSGRLVLNDPLSNEQTRGSWHLTDPHKPVGCHILNGAYHVREFETIYCLVDHTSYLTNFVYQIEMSTIQEQPGQAGGIVFRVDDVQHFYYDFQVSADGSYTLYRSDPTQHGPDPAIWTGHSTAIIRGYQQYNVLAVKAIGEDLFLYINFQLVAHIQDLSYTRGNIGVGIVVSKGPKETEVAFRNAKVWTL